MRSAPAARDTVIRPPKGLVDVDLREVWRFRSLLWRMAVRQVRVEFDQMYLGFLWAVARPVIITVVFALFRNLSGANTGVVIPYPLYVFSGLVLWFYFTESVQATSASVARDASLIQKVYFPRLLSPLSSILAGTVPLAVGVVPLSVLMLYYGAAPGWRIVLLPLVLLQCAVLIFGIGSLFAALTLRSRDWERFLMFGLYVGLFVSPVIYAPDLIPASARTAYFVNPMAGSLLGFRSAVFAEFPFPWGQWLYSVAFSLVALVVGGLVFHRAERDLVDRL
jgi:lipopolysaccharide transport system permease protein